MNKLAGVQAATVNLATEKLTVHYDKEQLNTAAIEAAVTKAGYQAFTEKLLRCNRQRKTPFKVMATILVVCHFTVPLFYLAMGEMIGLPLLPFEPYDTACSIC